MVAEPEHSGGAVGRARSGVAQRLQQAAPTADQLNAVFGDVRDSLPQTLANLAVVIDMLKRYNKGLEQVLVVYPQGAAIAQANVIFDNEALVHLGISLNIPPPCLTGFVPAAEWRFADTSMAPLPSGTYCKIPKDFQGNVVRGARNYPCVDVPGKRRLRRGSAAATSRMFQPMVRRPEPDPELPGTGSSLRPAGRPRPGHSGAVDQHRNPPPADQLPPTTSPAPISDP